jgi:hypothetical protein
MLKNPYLDSFIWFPVAGYVLCRCEKQRGPVWAPFLKKEEIPLWITVRPGCLGSLCFEEGRCVVQRGLVVWAPSCWNLPLWKTVRPIEGSFCSMPQEASGRGTPVFQLLISESGVPCVYVFEDSGSSEKYRGSFHPSSPRGRIYSIHLEGRINANSL